MKAKEFIIEKLVAVGKKHRWMKYPMLALVSLVSLFFLLVETCMEKPKRAVIALVCLVLIISQSWYLISMAGDGDVDNSPESQSGYETGDSMNLVGTSETEVQYTVNFNMGVFDSYNIFTGQYETPKALPLSSSDFPYTLGSATSVNSKYYEFEGWYLSTDTTMTNKITYVTSDLFPDSTNTITLVANWTKKAIPVTFSPGTTGAGTAVTGESLTIPVTIGDVDSTASIDLNDTYEKYESIRYTCTGYHFSQWKITLNSGSTGTIGIRDTYSVSDKATLVPDWQPNTYTINFQSQATDAEGVAATGSMESVTATYDTACTLPELGFTKAGYSFVGWKILGSEETGTFGPGASVLNLTATAGGSVTLVAQWSYNTIMLNGSPDTAEVVATYSEGLDKTLEITGGTGTLTRELYSVKGTSIDGANINTQKALADVTGITIEYTEGENSIHLSSESVKTVSTEKVVLTFMITDTENNKTAYPSVAITLSQKELKIDGATFVEKTYDGTNVTGVGSIQFSGQKSGAKVQVYSDGNGVYDNANAGENKAITVSGIVLNGDDSKYYTAPTSATFYNGVIKKATAYVTTSAAKTTILTGEIPTYTFEVSDKGLPADTTVAEADKALIQQAADKYVSCAYGASNDYSLGQYSIGIDTEQANAQLTNYDISVTPGTLVVEEKDPILDTDYSITGKLSEDGKWYYSYAPYVEVKNTDVYDSVYVMTDASKKAVHCDGHDERFNDTGVITQEISLNAEVYIQLGSKKTGAVSALKRVVLKVDTTAPTVNTESITLRSVKQTPFSQIGNFLSFGNFFKEELEVSVPIADDANGSGAKAVVYYLIPDGTLEADVEGVSETVGANDTATFRIPNDFKGEIKFVAQDKAGNVSERAGLIGVDGTAATVNYWVIENTAPIVTIEAKDIAGNDTSSEDGYYYKKVTVTACVEDAEAGVNHLEWHIIKDGTEITEDSTEEVGDTTKLLTSYNFQRVFEESGTYTVSAIAVDNATNESLETETVTFTIDAAPPEVTVTPEDYDDTWATSKTIQFSIADSESGINYFTVKAKTDYSDSYNNTIYPYNPVKNEENTYTLTITEKGTYTIITEDNAGNRTEVPLKITRVSNQVPEDPVVTYDPEQTDTSDIYWFTTNPVITVTEPEQTEDGTKITTYYHLWKSGSTEPYQNSVVNGTFTLPEEGIYNLRVWAVTESGLASEQDGLYQIYYDGTTPVISDVMLSGTGTSSKVSFKVAENVSGLAKVEAVYNRTSTSEGVSQPLNFTYDGNGVYSASFTASQSGKYEIRATDQAGNVGYADAFEPMSIQVTSVMGDTDGGITVLGTVYPGSFALDSTEVFYGLESAKEQTTKADDLILVTNEDGSVAFTAKFTQLDYGTKYVFRVKASSVDGEVCSYTGAFKTGSASATGITLTGTVTDLALDNSDDSYVSVSLYEGSSVIQTLRVRNNDSFTFNNVEDGIYTVQAQNGNRSASVGVLISNGLIVEPVSVIHLILKNGETTSVEYESEDTPNIIISGLENLFDDTTNFNDSDYDVINAGGMVEFKMNVKAVAEDNVPVTDRNLIQKNMKNNETVAMYLDLSIFKRVYSLYGLISEEQVTAINGGKSVRIVIPLGTQLAAQDGLSVIRVHDGTVERLVDIDTNPDTYTFQSSLYSTYALVYSEPKQASDSSNVDSSDSASTTDISTPSNADKNTSSPSASNSDSGKSNNGVSASNSSGKSSSYSSPATGDATPVALLIALMMTALLAGCVRFGTGRMAYHNKNKKNER